MIVPLRFTGTKYYYWLLQFLSNLLGYKSNTITTTNNFNWREEKENCSTLLISVNSRGDPNLT